MIEFICYNIILLSLFYLIYVFLLKNEKNLELNRIYLLTSLLLCFASPYLQLDYGLNWNPINKIDQDITTANLIDTSPDVSFGNSEIIQYQTPKEISVISIIYFTISFVMLLRLLWNLKKVSYLIKSSKKLHYRGQEISLTEDTNSPFSFFNYIFLRPKHLENETDLKSILLHENCHSQQYHSFDIILVELLMCFSWFNPFIWLFKKEIETNHEFLADSFVINAGINLDFYSTLIVNQSKKNILGIYSGFSLIKTKNRLNMLHQQKSSIFKNALKISFAFLLSAGIFVLSSSTPIKEDKSFVVLIDPGHGGEDAGNLEEKNINLEITNQLLELSESSDIKIISTRDSDEFISLNDRVKLINKIKPDLLLSLHCNASNNIKQNGVEGYYSSNNLFEKVSKSFIEILVQKQLESDNKNGNIKSANFIILKDSKVPSVLLELGFLTNDMDSKKLQDKIQQKIIASRILDGLKHISSLSN
ncbi:M56/M15 family metallopeptidase [Gramella sp. AN32]|uniref:N-acetylmuramoyl-L-alanine amidase n=1 Tax=Christiangramia antarctica TaxID=2058158 RepID=A0ABW5XAK3_9FLAO|nr:M56/M15 family metallopeptidase [Gramella sp. AN32]MCM4155965.1 hypothetical protein [Gramella sp. AN32]